MFAIIKSSVSALKRTSTSNVGLYVPGMLAISGLFMQQRFGSRGGNRGDTYQPNTLKRKRRLGFLARMKSRTGRQIVKRRFEKGRWFLTH
jgi:ribosomal protein L34